MLGFAESRKRLITKAVTALNKHAVDPLIQARLAAFFLTKDSRELYHTAPSFIAQQLQLSERNTLNVLVIALREGLVTLHWEVKCPVCHSLDLQPQCLADLRTDHTCPNCQHTHATIADEQVQVTFSIDERLRKLGPKAQDLSFRAEVEARYGTTSGHSLLTLQTFRNLFPRETLLPNESLLVRRVVILFTDLAGSTALYARRGDTRAYNLVRQHFEILFRVIDEHHGVVVKTIGDAVMGAFTVPRQALQAAIAMHQQMAQLNQQLSLIPEDQLILKIGIDAGPCLNVSLNDRLDYFGITVNTAARVQATSSGHNIAVTNAITADLEAAFVIPGWTWQKESLMLKGIDDPVVVHYLQQVAA